MLSVKISGTGSAVPDKVVSNDDLANIVNTSDSWIRERTGILNRRICTDDEASSDLALLASQRALENANCTAADIDLIIVATTTPDHITFPSTGCLIQHKLGAPEIPAFDISAACSGFVYGLSCAAAYLRSGMYKRILLVSVDTLSKYLNWEDRTTCILFGDGAGVLVLEASENPEDDNLLSFDLHARGSGADMLIVPEGGSRTPFNKDTFAANRQFLTMDGQAVYKFAVNVIIESLSKALDSAGLTKEDITFFTPHQANYRIINFAAAKLGLKPEQIRTNLDRYGNTSSASIPLLIDELSRNGELKKGDIIAAVGFGAGLTWGSSIIRW